MKNESWNNWKRAVEPYLLDGGKNSRFLNKESFEESPASIQLLEKCSVRQMYVASALRKFIEK